MTVPRIVVLAGPTAAGKSALALSLARAFPLEVVNADSMQVYRFMDIGTAKPTVAERAQVPHHVIDVADPDEPYNAGRYVSDAEKAVADIVSRGKVPIVVGGTGMYIRALLRGLDPLPSDPEVRRSLARRWDEEGAPRSTPSSPGPTRSPPRRSIRRTGFAWSAPWRSPRCRASPPALPAADGP